MPGPVSSTPPFGVQDATGLRALAVISPNTRVKGSQGMMGTAVDQLLFPGVPPQTVYGQWVVPNARVQIGGVRTVGATSQGMAFTINPGGFPSSNGPLLVSTPDRRISNS